MILAVRLLLLLSSIISCCIAVTTVDINPNGEQKQQQPRQRPQLKKATFVNNLAGTQHLNLYWAGNVGSNKHPAGVLQLYYGPIAANGGQMTIDGYDNQVFVLTDVGGYTRYGEYQLSDGEKFVVNEESAKHHLDNFPPNAVESKQKEQIAQKCRSTLNDKASSSSSFMDRCQKCAEVEGCGFSQVRKGCFASHSVASVNDVAECKELGSIEDANRSQSVDALLNIATEKIRILGHGSKSLRVAYKYLEIAVKTADKMINEAENDKASINEEALLLARNKAMMALLELTTKLEAVFDDTDMEELIMGSRHPKLAEIHPDMSVVPRRTTNEATDYILRGEPVVITDMFDSNAQNPVVYQWTLDYLNQNVFGAASVVSGGDSRGAQQVPKFNVAADQDTRCCRYYEPQGKSLKAGYPYPFVPTTHLYRDTFGGFVNTIRNENIQQESNSTTTQPQTRTLHYLHEIVMNAEGEVIVAGGAAPQQLKDDLAAVTTQLIPLASNQAFFGGFAYAKVWLGQKGIVMPIHYDATDNMYVMAWGRKRAIIGEPGQLDTLYRYPNGHPLAGSSQVNLTEPDLEQHPHFAKAKLREVIVGPGDVLYLPAWWWHQFEQPFEDTAALNMWSKDKDQAPSAELRDMRIREHVLADQLEESIMRIFGSSETGIILDALKNSDREGRSTVDQNKLKKAKDVLISAAKSWQQGVSQLPGGHSKMMQSPIDLVEEYLDRTFGGSDVMMDPTSISSPTDDHKKWHPGMSWDLTQIAPLPHMDRCKAAPESTPFMSLCD